MPAYHDKHLIHTTLANRRRDKLRHLAIPQVHMSIERRRQRNFTQFGEFHICSRVAAGWLPEGEF
jgi:hypothetical protein